LLRDLHSEGLTLILITHDPSIGESAQRLIRMRDGRLVSDLRGDAIQQSHVNPIAAS
jgi:predicted ABC-type transport system involved in lysophospholipase L1 biosynthesis ATPase subunit